MSGRHVGECKELQGIKGIVFKCKSESRELGTAVPPEVTKVTANAFPVTDPSERNLRGVFYYPVKTD